MKLEQYLNGNSKLLKLLSTQIKHILQFGLQNTYRSGERPADNLFEPQY